MRICYGINSNFDANCTKNNMLCVINKSICVVVGYHIMIYGYNLKPNGSKSIVLACDANFIPVRMIII